MIYEMEDVRMRNSGKKLRVGIIGTGKIGTDLLMKILRSEHLECDMFVGRNLQSPGMQKAQQLGVNVSDKGIAAFTQGSHRCELVFDATAAHFHREHANVFAAQGIRVVDLTPAKIGPFCIPALNESVILNELNVNMVTCGGQASVPVTEAVKSAYSRLSKVRVHTLVSDDSIGQATLDNVDDYYATTSKALRDFAGVSDVEVLLQVDEPGRQPTMCTTLHFTLPEFALNSVIVSLNGRERQLQTYVPGLRLEYAPVLTAGEFEVKVWVSGMGDWIPAHAGNLDIINCAAIAVAERFAAAPQNADRVSPWYQPLSRLLGGKRELVSA